MATVAGTQVLTTAVATYPHTKGLKDGSVIVPGVALAHVEIAPIVGGGGGGRPDFAEAGGKQPEKIDEMLEASKTVIEKLLSPA